MILRSPAENENGVISFYMALSSTRHSRARGNPGSLRRIHLDTRFRGYDRTQAGLLVLVPKQVFSKEHTKGSDNDFLKFPTFVLFVTFVVNIFPSKPGTTQFTNRQTILKAQDTST